MGGKRRKRKKRHGGVNEEELGGIGFFGPVARISNSEEKAQFNLLDNRLEILKSGMKLCAKWGQPFDGCL